MEFVSAKCPNCAGELQLDAARDNAFCQYCGSKILTKAAVAFHKVELSGKVEVSNASSVDKQIVILKRELDKIDILRMDYDLDGAREVLKRMEELEPEHPYFYMFSDFIDSIYGIAISITYGVYREKPHKQKKWFSSRTLPEYEKMSVYEWEESLKWYKSHKLDRISGFDRWLICPEYKVVVTDFVKYFFKVVMNIGMPGYSRYASASSTSDVRYYDFIRNGTLYTAIAIEPFSSRDKYSIENATANPSFRVSDHVIEYLLPKFQKDLKSPNKDFLIKAMREECKKYPNGY